MRKLLAFTLAEVLVTLGIIGVVSSLTLPTLMKNHQRQVYVTQLRKVHTEMSQAVENALLDRNALNLREARLNAGNEGTFLKSYFKVVKDCGTSDTSCFVASYDILNQNGTVAQRNDMYKVTLASGASIALLFNNSGTAYGWTDINGIQGPNIACRDLFDFNITANGTIESPYCMGQLMENGWVMDEHYDSIATW